VLVDLVPVGFLIILLVFHRFVAGSSSDPGDCLGQGHRSEGIHQLLGPGFVAKELGPVVLLGGVAGLLHPDLVVLVEVLVQVGLEFLVAGEPHAAVVALELDGFVDFIDGDHVQPAVEVISGGYLLFQKHVLHLQNLEVEGTLRGAGGVLGNRSGDIGQV